MSSFPSQPPLVSDHRFLKPSEKIAFAAGSIPYGIAYFILAQLAYPVFNLTLGLSATAIGVVLAIGRFWDAITDPIIGWWSDNCRSRWGRRKPFMLGGVILLAIIMPLMWVVPQGSSSTFTLGWFAACSFIFYIAATLFCVPWLALSYEMTPNPQERTNLHAYRAYGGALVGLALPWMFRWTQADIFDDVVQGAFYVCVISGLICIFFTLPILIGCQERFAAQAAHQDKIPFWPALKTTLTNRPFMVFELGIVTVVLCTPVLVGSMLVYVNTYYVFAGDAKAGASLAALTVSSFVVIKIIVLPLAVKLAARFGKVALMRVSLILGLIGALLQYPLVTPTFPYLQLLTALLLSPAYTAFWLLVDPMKADCADYDEWQTGLRREGAYAAMANWIEKVAVSLALLLSGMAIDFSGFQSELGADQPAATIEFMRIFLTLAPAAGFIVALVALQFYGLDDHRMRSLRTELETRRGPRAAFEANG
ncbi:MAG: MFS transporter [Candidatus Methylacidiphilales bacterium]